MENKNHNRKIKNIKVLSNAVGNIKSATVQSKKVQYKMNKLKKNLKHLGEQNTHYIKRQIYMFEYKNLIIK